MSELGLYYPYIHVQDDVWLKAAALYWPRLGRMVPREYALRDSDTARRLRDELDFFVDIDPRPYAKRTATDFLTFVETHKNSLRSLYSLPTDIRGDGWQGGQESEPEHDPRIIWIHAGDKMEKLLATEVAYADLAVTRAYLGRDHEVRSWVGLHRRLGLVYLAALADRVAQANQMPVVTDQDEMHGALNGWTMDTLANVLLEGDFGDESPYCTTVDNDKVERLYVATAVSTVIPKGLEHVPIERIVRARRTLADEFDAFRAHLDSLNDQFTELAGIESPEVLQARLQLLVDRDLRHQTTDLERGLRQLGLEPARAVLGMKSLELPAALAAAATGAGIPAAVGQAGRVAGQLVSSSLRARDDARQQRRGTAGYLLGLREELDPRGVVDRVRRTLRHMASRRGRRR